MENESAALQPFPPEIIAAVRSLDDNELVRVVWSELEVDCLGRSFALPPAGSGSYASFEAFVEIEIKLQVEITRDELDKKVHQNSFPPKEGTEGRKAEKHVRFPLPHRLDTTNRILSIDLHELHREPNNRVKFTNYVMLLQTKELDNMKNICLAFCSQMRKDGAVFHLGKDSHRLDDVPAGQLIYARPLRNHNMLKTHIRALAALNRSSATLGESKVARQLLSGQIASRDTRSLADLDSWIREKSSNIPLESFNGQQRRALALEALTQQGIVLIQGPPGTGKSHTICHGILPQAASRHEKILVVCNSNVAVDSLMLKCYHNNESMKPWRSVMKRLGYKENINDEIVDLDLYAEGNDLSIADRYGNIPGANSNTDDAGVQKQIRSAPIIFTTIHFASKEKKSSADEYWNFDTLVLDEAAQIEDSRLLIVLARCQTLKKLILVGDPKQLQPYVPESLRRQNYGKSTMERLMDASPASEISASYVMLEEQYRMAPQLRSLVSALYYEDRLKDGPDVHSHGPISENVDLKPLLVVNVTNTVMTFNRVHQSYENRSEAAVVKFIYEFLFSSDFDCALPGKDLQRKDVCVLTPYNRHKDRLRMLICDVDEDALDSYAGQTFGTKSKTFSSPPRFQSPSRFSSPVRSSSFSSPASARSPMSFSQSPQAKKSQAIYGSQEVELPQDAVEAVENIDTVDKFQGSERKVVIISTCVDKKPLRSSDPHFINVACSRAQHLLIVVGNFTDGLAPSADWMHVKKAAETKGSYFEHRVTRAAGADPDNDQYDIHEKLLEEKLKEIVERPRKKAAR